MATCGVEQLGTRLLAVVLLTPAAGLAAAAPPAPAAATATATTASTATDPAKATPGDVGPAPGIPAALFTMAPAPQCAQPLCWWAHSNQPGVPSLTASRNHIVMINPDIVDTTRGVSHITADRAEETGADIGDSQILLTGDVHTDMEQGEISADTTTIVVVSKRISSIVAQGNPARFLRRGSAAAPESQGTGGQPPGRQAAGGQAAGRQAGGNQAGAGPGSTSQSDALASEAVYGHADSITYDLKADTVQLDGNSWLTDGCNEFTSQRITYNLASQTVQAGPAPGSKGRVYGTIRNTHPGASCTTAGRS